jgi:hypothetical protein
MLRNCVSTRTESTTFQSASFSRRVCGRHAYTRPLFRPTRNEVSMTLRTLSTVSESVIRAEYQRLCNAMGLVPVPLDIYVSDDQAPPESKTPLGSFLRNATPGYSGTKRIMVLPLCTGDDQPEELPSFPPPLWSKHGWPAWRFELWHEVVHQVSNDLMGSWDPKEPGRIRRDRSTSDQGHGIGWFRGICRLAAVFGADPEEIDLLLDR